MEQCKARRIIHVVKNPIGRWDIKGEKKEPLLGYAPTKAKAEQIAKKIAEQAPFCRVKVHKVDGTLEKDYVYMWIKTREKK